MLSVLNSDRIAANAATLVAVAGRPGDSYFATLARLQYRSPVIQSGDGPRLQFTPDPFTAALLSRILTDSGTDSARLEWLTMSEEQDARAKLAQAITMLGTYHPSLPASVRHLVSTLIFARLSGFAGGSSIAAPGMVWMSAQAGWTATQYAECLCHELVHQALFLEDMLMPLFTEVDEDTLVVSSIRCCLRPFENSYHAAIVAGALIELYGALEDERRASDLRGGLAESVSAIAALRHHLTSRAEELLAEVGALVGVVVGWR